MVIEGPAEMKGALSRAVLFTERVEEVENAGSLSWWVISNLDYELGE